MELINIIVTKLRDFVENSNTNKNYYLNDKWYLNKAIDVCKIIAHYLIPYVIVKKKDVGLYDLDLLISKSVLNEWDYIQFDRNTFRFKKSLYNDIPENRCDEIIKTYLNINCSELMQDQSYYSEYTIYINKDDIIYDSHKNIVYLPADDSKNIAYLTGLKQSLVYYHVHNIPIVTYQETNTLKQTSYGREFYAKQSFYSSNKGDIDATYVPCYSYIHNQFDYAWKRS